MSGFSTELRTAKRAVRVGILVAIVFIGLGINQLNSEQPSSSGRGISGMLSELLYTYFGAAGLCALWIVLAVISLTFARLIWRHTPHAPSDRWYRD